MGLSLDTLDSSDWASMGNNQGWQSDHQARQGYHLPVQSIVQVNEESDDDEGYNSIIGTTEVEVRNRRRMRRRKPREEELILVEESLKDDQDEGEEEMRLRRSELLKLVELMKVMQEEKEGDKNIIRRQQEIIDTWAKEQSGACQGEDGTNNIIL